MKSGRLTKKGIAGLVGRMRKLGWEEADLAFHSKLNQTTVWRLLSRRGKANQSTLHLIEMALDKGEREHAEKTDDKAQSPEESQASGS